MANYVLRFAGNRDLFLNMMNWLSADEDLISIRPKEAEDRRLSAKPSQFWMLYVSSALPALAAIARRYGADLKVVEVPPGPPVLSPIVAEIYGPDYAAQMRLARAVRGAFEALDRDGTPKTYELEGYPAVVVQHDGEVLRQFRHVGVPKAAVAAQARHHEQRRPAAMPLVVELRAIAQFQVRHRALLARCIARLPCQTGWLSSRA